MAESKSQKINITVGKASSAPDIDNQAVVPSKSKIVKAQAISSRPADDFYSSKLEAASFAKPVPAISQQKTSKLAAAAIDLDNSNNEPAHPPRSQPSEAVMITPAVGEASPAKSPSSPSITQTASIAQQQQPESPARSRAFRKKLLGLIVIILLLLAGGAWAYAYLYQPRQAVAAYLERFAELQQGRFETAFDIKDDSANVDGRLSGVFDNRDQQNPRLQAEADINAGTGGVNLNIDSELRLVDQTLYLQPGDSFFWQLLLGGVEPSWYRLDLDDSQGLIDESCSEADIAAAQKYFEEEVTRVLQINNPSRGNLLGEDYEGRRVQRYSGEISDRNLVTMRQDLAERLSPECSRDDTAPEASLENMSIVYTLRTAEQFDRMELVIRDGMQTVGTINLTTEDYDQPVEVTAPAAARPIEELFGDDPESGFGEPGLFTPEAAELESAPSMLR